MEWWGRGVGRAPAFIDPRGQMHLDTRPPSPHLGEDPVAELQRQNRTRGADPDMYTAGACWKKERDIPDSLYFRALETIG